MKKILILFFTVQFCFMAMAEVVRINPAERNAVILIPQRPITASGMPPQELRYHIGKATGYSPQISRDAEAPAGSFVISLGETAFARRHGVSGAGMKHNHAQVVGDNDKLIITGNDRGNNLAALLVETSGTLFAVYKILEKFMVSAGFFRGKPEK